MKRILALGDSLTEGYIDDNTETFYPYTNTLQSILKVPVDNEGVSGERTGPMLSRLRQMNTHRGYTHAVILAGTNDLDTRMLPSTVAQNIIKMHLYCLKRLGVERTYCLSIPEVILGGKKRFQRKRKAINKLLYSFAQGRSDVVYVPFAEFAADLQTQSFSGNGWHFSEDGYKRMGKFIANVHHSRNSSVFVR